jgi:hypothetical protein
MPKRSMPNPPAGTTKRPQSQPGRRVGAVAGAAASGASERQREIEQIVNQAVSAGARRPSRPKLMTNYPRPGKTDRRGKGGV